MIHQIEAPAWTADWLVGWLASLGVAYRLPDVKLSWSDDVTPHAVFHVEADSLEKAEERLNQALPDMDELKALAVTRHLEGHFEFERNPSRLAYADRAMVARKNGDYSLGVCTSDVGVLEKDPLVHARLNVAYPRGITLADRLETMLEAADGETIVAAINGFDERSSEKGLGFDIKRLVAPSVLTTGTTSPIAEVLSFWGVFFFDLNGLDNRGWRKGSAFRTGAFQWVTWKKPLCPEGIDALFGEVYASSSTSMLSCRYESVPYQIQTSSDTTRAFASREVPMAN